MNFCTLVYGYIIRRCPKQEVLNRKGGALASIAVVIVAWRYFWITQIHRSLMLRQMWWWLCCGMIAFICDCRPNTIVDCRILNCPCVSVVAVACDLDDGREGRYASTVDFDGKRQLDGYFASTAGGERVNCIVLNIEKMIQLRVTHQMRRWRWLVSMLRLVSMLWLLWGRCRSVCPSLRRDRFAGCSHLVSAAVGAFHGIILAMAMVRGQLNYGSGMILFDELRVFRGAIMM